MISLLHGFELVSVAAAVAIALAFYKHHTLAAVEASAKKEIANLEALSVKVGADIKADYNTVVARLKAIF